MKLLSVSPYRQGNGPRTQFRSFAALQMVGNDTIDPSFYYQILCFYFILVPVLLLSTTLGSHGLDLSLASHVLMLEPMSNPNLEQQVRTGGQLCCSLCRITFLPHSTA
eukprot:GHVN01039522.1.p1 GENE.GHVN01039522.1~~GHVN01039522.1.p1  ORF type:complete len:108 (+),score=7.26 GHVN01039522.1:135-458(+)